VVAVAYERWFLTRGLKYSDLTCKLLVFWKTGRRGEVVATGGSTVCIIPLCLRSREFPIRALIKIEGVLQQFNTQSVCRMVIYSPRALSSQRQVVAKISLRACQAVEGLGQECKVELWLDSYISCYICFIKLNFSLITKLDVLLCLNILFRPRDMSRGHFVKS